MSQDVWPPQERREYFDPVEELMELAPEESRVWLCIGALIMQKIELEAKVAEHEDEADEASVVVATRDWPRSQGRPPGRGDTPR